MAGILRLFLAGVALTLAWSLEGLGRHASTLAEIQTPTATAAGVTPLPNRVGSLKFAVLGDFGTASKAQYELAAVMAKTHQALKYEIVLLVADNLYGSNRPQDYQKKFEIPYKPNALRPTVIRMAIAHPIMASSRDRGCAIAHTPPSCVRMGLAGRTAHGFYFRRR